MTEAEPKKRRRERQPFDTETADEILERITEGESLRAICRSDNMPNISTVMKWLEEFPLFQKQYARACELRADTLVEKALQIISTPEFGEETETTTGPDGTIVKVKRGDMIQHRRLQYDAIRWYAGKVRPKKWGDVKADEGDSGTIKIEGGLPDD
ncbi:MAG: terminase small subunit protein [Alphaproteobacteria bacterium]|nr:terminase small subunit protein [Alphaproteobacteria bacterium]